MKTLIHTILLGLFAFLPMVSAIADETPNPENRENFLPAPLLLLDDQFTRHAVVVEKNSHTLFVYKNENGLPKLVTTHAAATGKFPGNKTNEGDRKTPEGVYFISDFFDRPQLDSRYGEYSKIYGIGAFDLSYPNLMDRRAGKTGSNIWLHATDDNSRIEKGLDSRGCVVLSDENLKGVSQYLDLGNTPIIITQDLHFLSRKSFLKNRSIIKDLITGWVSAWESKDLSSYLSFYDQKRFRDPKKGSYSSFRAYKRRVFKNSDNPEIKMENLSILADDDYIVVQMTQNYKSNLVDDTGKKILYLKRNAAYDWKIVAEQFTKLPAPGNVTLGLNNRYFSE